MKASLIVNCFVFLFQTQLARRSLPFPHLRNLSRHRGRDQSRPTRSEPAGKPGWVAAMPTVSLEGMAGTPPPCAILPVPLNLDYEYRAITLRFSFLPMLSVRSS